MIATVPSFIDTLAVHGLSKTTQYRLLGFAGVPEYIQREFNEPKNGGGGGVLYLKSGSVPGREVVPMEIKYQGFQIPLPGQSKYESPITFKFRTPEDFLWRNALEQWNFETYNEMTANGSTTMPCANSILDIGLMGSGKGIVRIYRLYNVWPTKVGEISYDLSGDVAEVEFDVSIAYTRYAPFPVTDPGDGTVLNDEQRAVFEQYRSVIAANKATCVS